MYVCMYVYIYVYYLCSLCLYERHCITLHTRFFNLASSVYSLFWIRTSNTSFFSSRRRFDHHIVWHTTNFLPDITYSAQVSLDLNFDELSRMTQDYSG